MPLPAPDPAFRWSVEPWGAALCCVPLEAVARHLFTSKQLALPQQEGWASATASLGGDTTHLFRVKQVHGNTVRIIRRDAATLDAVQDRPDGDAIISNAEGAVLAVLVADCVPIVVADRRRGVAAAIHAGWRGTCARIASTAIDTMRREFDSDPADLVAAIGPSVGPDDYEVGASLIDAFRAQGHSEHDIGKWFIADGSTLHLDLWTANRDQLRMAGLRDANIHACGLSTVSHPDVLESYRVSGKRAGRMAALIVVPPAD